MNKAVTQLSPTIIKLLHQRGYSKENLNTFFSWDLKALPDFSTLQDISKSANRIVSAIENGESIAVYGDYDVDGTTSCALLYHFFKMINIEIKTYQPSRFIEGYGIHPPAIDQAQQDGVQLLMTVDCGITNNPAAERALEKNIDLIITDHHNDANDTMPPAFAIINPNRRDEPESPLQALAGVGVAFALTWEIKKELEKRDIPVPSLYPLLQLVAAGTICDLAKLNPMNLKLVRHGLKQLPKTSYPGLKVFLTDEERTFDSIPSEKLGFQIGPKINSKGRLENPDMSLELLITDDMSRAEHLHRQLEMSNNDRKFIQKEVFQQAKKVVQKEYSDKHLISIAYRPDWHEGVIGIVASKLVETFGTPAIVFTNTDQTGIIKASARSAGEFNLFEGLAQCKDLFIRFGGHKAAAGLSMELKNLQQFRTKINQILFAVPEIVRTNRNHFDIEITPEEINPTLMRDLEKLEPFGMGNEKPVFKMGGFKIISFKEVGTGHIKWELMSKTSSHRMSGISFNYFDKWNVLLPETLFERQNQQNLETFFTLGVNRFRGNEYLQLYIQKIVTSL